MVERLLTTAQVAEALGIKLSTFTHRIARLKREHGFPQPVPGLGNRYDPKAIQRWLDGQTPVVGPQTPDGSRQTPGEAETDWQAEIDRRAANLGRGKAA